MYPFTGSFSQCTTPGAKNTTPTPLTFPSPVCYNMFQKRTFVLYKEEAKVTTLEKLTILADAAKYDASCTSSGVNRTARPGQMGSAQAAGICHSFSADGRCISLLKVLLTNHCIYDCKYCVNRASNQRPRAAFSPDELARLTMEFYRRNYIEGLFLSSGVIKNPDYTCEQMLEVLTLLRRRYRFGGYIHCKAIPGADNSLITQMGLLADRLSVNIELPSQASLKQLAPAKTKERILAPMRLITRSIAQNRQELACYRHSPVFAPGGQSTQMIVGASPESDYQILSLTQGLYDKYHLKRVFFSAYIPVQEDSLLPSVETKPPLLREHRLYQADWLLRFYGFRAEELLGPQNPTLSPNLDPKCAWALCHPELFPVEVNTATYSQLLRVPGIGVTSARRILTARWQTTLDFSSLKKLGVVLKRAQYFLTCSGHLTPGLRLSRGTALRGLTALESGLLPQEAPQQLSLFDSANFFWEDGLTWRANPQ